MEQERRCSVRALLTDGAIDLGALLEETRSPSDGALVLFVGRVRDRNAGRPVARLTYEAYREMALEEFQRILEEAADRYDLGAVVGIHRLGVLEIGEPSLAIAVAAPHRAACYEASRTIVEELKRRLPVWKREEYRDGTVEWVGAEDLPRPRAQ